MPGLWIGIFDGLLKQPDFVGQKIIIWNVNIYLNSLADGNWSLTFEALWVGPSKNLSNSL